MKYSSKPIATDVLTENGLLTNFVTELFPSKKFKTETSVAKN